METMTEEVIRRKIAEGEKLERDFPDGIGRLVIKPVYWEDTFLPDYFILWGRIKGGPWRKVSQNDSVMELIVAGEKLLEAVATIRFADSIMDVLDLGVLDEETIDSILRHVLENG